MKSNEPGTTDVSIRVVKDPHGERTRITPPDDQEFPTLIASLVIDGDQRWRGYVFTLAYVGSELTRMEIEREGDTPLLGARILQQVPLGALDRAARRHVEIGIERLLADPPRILGPDLSQIVADWLDPVADPNPAGENDVRLAALCRRYLELDSESGWRETLADEFNYSPSAIPTIVARARKRRFLTKVARGQYGGQLTPKALRLLMAPEQREQVDHAVSEIRGPIGA
jgi:hypothetical protein